MGKETIDPLLLEDCRRYAEAGAKMAEEALRSFEGMLDGARHGLQSKLRGIQNQDLRKAMERELQDIDRYCRKDQQSIRNHIAERRKEMGKFTITLFGRTMAGKSTMMETLKHGNGESIGKGAQRTTRDVRPYEWNGLKIWDVPGIAAFEGKADTELAYDVAQKGDMIIFLLTDDKPDREEADCLQRLRELGKPVLGILNVKYSIKEGKPLRKMERDITERYQSEDLKKIIRQFYEFGTERGQDWSNIPFLPAHLKCAFLAQQETDPQKAALYERLSRFADVKEKIAEYVREKGKGLRMKTFVDIAYAPMEMMQRRAASYKKEVQSIQQDSRSMATKNQGMVQGFLDDLSRSEQALLNAISSDFRLRLQDFVEEYHDKKEGEIQEEFARLVNGLQMEQRINGFIAGHDAKFQRLSRRIEQDVSRNFASRRVHLQNAFSFEFDGGSLTDFKKYLNWTSTASAVVGLIPPLRLVSIGVGIGSFLVNKFGGLESIEEKHRKRKREMRQAIRPAEQAIMQQASKALDRYVESVRKQVRKVQGNVKELQSVVQYMNQVQDELNEQTRKIMLRLFESFCKGVTENPYLTIARMERRPGDRTVIYTSRVQDFYGDVTSRLEDALQEKIVIVRSR